MNTPTMTMQDEVEHLAAELRTRTAERDAYKALLAANQSSDMRAIVGELREALSEIHGNFPYTASKRLAALLRRLDESEGA